MCIEGLERVLVGTLRLVLVILHTYIDTQRTGFQKIISGLF